MYTSNSNVYNSDFTWPKGVVVKKLRIVQVTRRGPSQNYLNIFYGGDGRGLTKLVIGTVLVESDGSACFEAPVGRLIYFQAVDSLGTAVQSMRSGTYVHPGEHLTCSGCHEDKWKSVAPSNPKALQRNPSRIDPDVNNQEPINYYRLVKPVFEAKCLPCHKQKGQGIQDFSYDKFSAHALILLPER